MIKRDELIFKYERNRTFIIRFRSDYIKYLDSHNSWDKIAFFDSRITHRQYFDEFVKISDQEYSEKQYHAIKTIKIQEQFLDDYINGLDTQYINLSKLYSYIRPAVSDEQIALE